MNEQTPSELRQQYIETATRELRPVFERNGKPLPDKLRVSIGWTTSGKRALGGCFSDAASSDEHREVFISPVQATSLEVLETLAHELCHAALPYGVGHGKEFVNLGRSIGLAGKPTVMGAGPGFKWWLADFVKAHGEYPAGSINAKAREGKQPTNMLKCECSTCGYIARTTKKWITKVGAPHCPRHGEMDVC